MVSKPSNCFLIVRTSLLTVSSSSLLASSSNIESISPTPLAITITVHTNVVNVNSITYCYRESLVHCLHCSSILFKSGLLTALACLCDFSFGVLFDHGVRWFEAWPLDFTEYSFVRLSNKYGVHETIANHVNYEFKPILQLVHGRLHVVR